MLRKRDRLRNRHIISVDFELLLHKRNSQFYLFTVAQNRQQALAYTKRLGFREAWLSHGHGHSGQFACRLLLVAP